MNIWRKKSARRVAGMALGALCAIPCRAAMIGSGGVAGSIGVPIEHLGEALPYFMTVGGGLGAMLGAFAFVLAIRSVSWTLARRGMEFMLAGQLLFAGGWVMMP